MAGKIPGNCRVCGASLDRSAMERYLHVCEKMGMDPIAEAPDGIRCSRCAIREVMDEAEASPNSMGAKIVRSLRRDHLGMRAIPGGKKGK